MRIVINCWVLRNKNLDGIGYFTVNILKRIIKNNPEVSFILLCDKDFTEPYFDFANVKIERLFLPYRHPILYIFYMEIILPFFLKKLKPDLFVGMEGFLSLRTSYKQLAVIYDLNFEHYPENMAIKNRLYYRFFFIRFARKAFRIATISEYSKLDIARLYKISPNKIDNVSCGINNNFFVLSSEEKTIIKDKFSFGKPYFFFIGSMHPRKNINRLILAFNEFKIKTDSNFKLVIGGAMLWKTSIIIDTYNKSPFKEDIIFTGRLSELELKQLLGAAYALTFVPVFEGFGLPLVEAFEAEVPVITSNVTSLPEVAGDAAVYVDPFDVTGIADGMKTLFENKDNLRKRLIEKGFIQKQQFSWDHSADLFWQSIKKAIS